MKKFGKDADKAVLDEFPKLHMMETFILEMRETLTKQQRKRALRTIMFLKQKRDRSLRGRMCADGSVQRELYDKAEASSPTVATESVLMTAVIDAFEGRDTAVIDLPSAYLHANMKDVVHMRLTGKLAELMVATAPEIYRPFVTYGKKERSGAAR